MMKDPTLIVFPNLRLLLQIALTLPVISNLTPAVRRKGGCWQGLSCYWGRMVGVLFTLVVSENLLRSSLYQQFTSNEAERSFSWMRRVLTWLRPPQTLIGYQACPEWLPTLIGFSLFQSRISKTNSMIKSQETGIQCYRQNFVYLFNPWHGC